MALKSVAVSLVIALPYMCMRVHWDIIVLPIDPQFSYEFPMEYLQRVKKTHESGGYGSIG